MKEFTTFLSVINTSRPMSGPNTGLYIYPHFKNFITAFENLNKTINGKKEYTEKEIADYVFKFRVSIKDTPLVKQFLKRRFYVANSYLQYLNKKFNEANIHNYIDVLSFMVADYAELFEQIYSYNITVPDSKFERLNWRRKIKPPFQIYRDAQTFFNIRDYTDIQQLHFSELEPYSIFAMRQVIEEMGKGMLGVILIVGKDNIPSIEGDKVLWEFIALELNKPKPRISVPFEITVMNNIKRWCNNFVHTTVYADVFIIWQALEMLQKLVEPCMESVKGYSDTPLPPGHSPNIRIYEYNSVKTDFEHYLTAKSLNRKGDNIKQLKPLWIDHEKWGIQGYVMSL